MAKHGETERKIIELFQNAKQFYFEGNEYEIIVIGKPSPNRGECKTDVYIDAKKLNTNLHKEFKISIKQNDADFLENKIKLERAQEIFGNDWKKVLIKSIESVKNDFLNDALIYFRNCKRTKEGCIKIGWKFELLNKNGGERSGALLLTPEQKIDVYSGSNLNADKKDSMVNRVVIGNSGVANYILEVANTDNDLDFYLNKLEAIDKFAIKQDVYFACKAINYRFKENKWDGNRPLSVYVDWSIKEGLLTSELIMNRPLEVKADEIGHKLRGLLNKLNFCSDNFSDFKEHLDPKVNIEDAI